MALFTKKKTLDARFLIFPPWTEIELSISGSSSNDDFLSLYYPQLPCALSRYFLIIDAITINLNKRAAGKLRND